MTWGQYEVDLEGRLVDLHRRVHAGTYRALPSRRVFIPKADGQSLSRPLVSLADRPADPCHAVKDPSVVSHGGKWHLFATIRSRTRTHQIEYLSFADWDKADAAPRHVLAPTDGYFCAPRVFWFTPHRRWDLVYQITDPARRPRLQPAFSTTTDIGDPASWTKPTPLFEKDPEGVTGWIDFWMICDATHARLFFTSNDGRMWRSDARKADFPHRWGKPRVVLTADIFEASHTYKVKGADRYFTFVEAQAGDRRYFEAYTADKLDGDPKTGKAGPWVAGMTLDPGAVSEGWCHQRGYVCMIQEIGGRPVKAGDVFGAAYVIGFFDTVADMERVYDRYAGHRGLRAAADGWKLTRTA